mmetsp:Transcript_9800/g.17726  ORF Transcript_9800/g.17726 Transcript_9800/m.17726 type:complete len:456 (-) Transcript_9800:37-1404(-)
MMRLDPCGVTHGLTRVLLLACAIKESGAKWVSHDEELLAPHRQGFRSISLNSHAIGIEHEHSFIHDHSFLQERAKAYALDRTSEEAQLEEGANLTWKVSDKDLPIIAEILEMLNVDTDDLTYTWFQHEETRSVWYYDGIRIADTNPVAALAKHLIIGHGLGFVMATRTGNTWTDYKAAGTAYADPHPDTTKELEKKANYRARRNYLLEKVFGYADTKGFFAKLTSMDLSSLRHFHEHDHLGPKDARWATLPKEDKGKIPITDYQASKSVAVGTFLLGETGTGDGDDLIDFINVLSTDYSAYLRDFQQECSKALEVSLKAEGGPKMVEAWPRFKKNWMNPHHVKEVYSITLKLIDFVIDEMVVDAHHFYLISGVVVYENCWKSEVMVEITHDEYQTISEAGETSKEGQTLMYGKVQAWADSMLAGHSRYFEANKWLWWGGDLVNFLMEAGKPIEED